jgi:cyclopropane fatty-acyl-phospholipid synthase-like methyltransferase
MISFLTYFLSWFAIIILLGVLVLLTIWMWEGFKSKVPFIPVSTNVLKDIENMLSLKEDSVLYDLGCGDGKVLFHMAKSQPNAKYIGIENNLFAVILARAKAWWFKKDRKVNIEILNEDFFKHDISNATHIFLYLYPQVMDELLSKFESELKPGTKLVSASFRFTLKQPEAEIDLNRSKYKLARKLYVYQF